MKKQSLKKPLISVVIPTYNRAHVIKRAINSVINQTYLNWELIIVDDGSIDNTNNVIKHYLEDERIKYYKIKNSGASATRNYGIKKSQGKYVSFLDSDDEYQEDRLNYQYNKMIQNKVSVSLSNAIISINGTKTLKNNPKSKDAFPIFHYKDIKRRIISASVILMKKEIANKVLFDKKLPSSNDLDFILRVLNKNKVLYISRKLTIIHKKFEERRLSSNFSGKITGYNLILKKIKRHVYNLKKNDLILLKKDVLKRLGRFNLLDKNYQEGRKYLDKYFSLESRCVIEYWKYKLTYYLSFCPSIFRKLVQCSRKFYWNVKKLLL
jgi:glycosyltransferase involved in cell wall biosynthesis